MTPVVEVTVPIKTVGNNGREHWRPKAKRVRHEGRVFGLALSQFDSRSVQLPAVVRITRCSFGELDDDNLRGAGKKARDSVATWLGIDDGDVAKVMYQYAQAWAPRKTHAVKIEVFGGCRLIETLEEAK